MSLSGLEVLPTGILMNEWDQYVSVTGPGPSTADGRRQDDTLLLFGDGKDAMRDVVAALLFSPVEDHTSLTG
ncbi:MAG TPA: hypothetical protein DGF10_08760 [Acidimicrobiaceae bacterium]|nr:hypothetical protein [Acidimicrobiaceae bacterium]